MIRFLFRWLFRGLLLAIVLALGLFVAKDSLLREWLIYRLRAVTGLEARLARVESGLLAGQLTLTGLQLYNSAEFGGGPLLRVPDLHLEIDRASLNRREVKLRLVRLDLAELNVVRNQRGQTNLHELHRRASERATPADVAVVSPPGFEFGGIETLNLSLGTIRMIDLGTPAASRELNLGITNEVVRQVRSVADLNPIFVRAMLRLLGGALQPGQPPDAGPPGGRSPANRRTETR